MRYQPLKVNCPKCGKPLKKDKGGARYSCGNSACPVIEVRNPDKPFMQIQYEARFRS